MISLRKIILVMVIIALPIGASAWDYATKKGSWKISGGLYTAIFHGSVSLSVEEFVAEGLSVGGEFIYFGDASDEAINGAGTSSIGIMPAIALNLPFGDNDRSKSSSFLFLKIGSGGAKYWSPDIVERFDGAYSSKGSTFGWFLAGHIGIMPKLSRSVGLEIGMLLRRDFPNDLPSFDRAQFGVALTIFAL